MPAVLIRASFFPPARPVVGEFQEPGQGEFEAGEKWRGVDIVFLDDQLDRFGMRLSDDRHDPLEPVDDPVFLDAHGQYSRRFSS